MSKTQPAKRRRRRNRDRSAIHAARKRYEVRKDAKKVHTVVIRLPRVVIDPGKTWLVARVVPRLELVTALGLAYDGIEPYLPAVSTRGVLRGRLRTAERNPLPGYMFAGLPTRYGCHERLRDFHHAEVAAGRDGPLLGVFGPVRARELQRLADRIAEEPFYGLAQPSTLCAGDAAIVRDGPFAGFPAVVVDMLADGNLRADVNLFGRATSVEFEPRQLEAA